MLQVPAMVTVLLFAIVIGPADIPFVLAGIVMFSLMVFALVLIIDAVPNDGPPSVAPMALNRPSATDFV